MNGYTSNAEPTRLMRRHPVLAMTGLSQTRLYDLMGSEDAAVRFPRPIKIGRGAFWVEADVQAWIARQIERHAAAA